MSVGTEIYRKTLLTVAGNKAVENLSIRYGKKLAGKFIAGNTLEEALEEIRILNNKGIMATLDHLGEGITRLSEAALYRDEYVRLVEGIAREGVDSNVSLKPTQMGLALDPEEGYQNIRTVAAQAKLHDLFVRIDMEDSPFTQATLDIVRRLHSEGLRNTGTVLQAYLHRTEEDTRDMIREGIRLRLVKGAYKEPGSVAYQNTSEVIHQFKTMIRNHLDQGVYTAVASHDDHIINWTKQYAKDRGISPDAFEFQMLYGLRMGEQERLAKEGYRIRCYVPCWHHVVSVLYPPFGRKTG